MNDRPRSLHVTPYLKLLRISSSVLYVDLFVLKWLKSLERVMYPKLRPLLGSPTPFERRSQRESLDPTPVTGSTDQSPDPFSYLWQRVPVVVVEPSSSRCFPVQVGPSRSPNWSVLSMTKSHNQTERKDVSESVLSGSSNGLRTRRPHLRVCRIVDWYPGWSVLHLVLVDWVCIKTLHNNSRFSF